MTKVLKPVRPIPRIIALDLLTRSYPVGVVEPLAHAWTIKTDESPAASACTDPAWKKSINALVSGDRNRATRPVHALTSADVVTPPKLDAPKKLNWSDDVDKTLFGPPGDIAAEKKMGEKAAVKEKKQFSKTQGRVSEKCDCALENALFEPES
jgi:hypothetical protein